MLRLRTALRNPSLRDTLGQMMEELSLKEKETPYLKMTLIFNQYEGLDLHLNSKGEGFRFPVYILDKYKDMDIEMLELTERSKHCLKRGGFRTIYDLMNGITGRQDLLKIKSLGVTSSREIMEHLFLFQYAQLKPDQRDWYINRIVEMNRKKNAEA